VKNETVGEVKGVKMCISDGGGDQYSVLLKRFDLVV
jgi:hypothetical protein